MRLGATCGFYGRGLVSWWNIHLPGPSISPAGQLAVSKSRFLQAVQNCLGHVQILARQLLGASVVVQGSYAQVGNFGFGLRGAGSWSGTETVVVFFLRGEGWFGKRRNQNACILAI